mgnify:CR=1 FL=1
MKNKLLLYFAILLFSACNGKNQLFPDYKIASPSSERTYYSNQSIVFSTNLNFSELTWKSNLDGELGNGAQIVRKLSPGLHIISLENEVSGEIKNVSINILKSDSKFDINLITSFPFVLETECKKNDFSIISLEGGCEKLSIEKLQTNESYSDGELSSQKLFRCVTGLNLENSTKILKPTLNRRVAGEKNLPSEKIFYVINTHYQAFSNRVYAELFYTSENVSVYVEKKVLENEEITERISSCIKNLESIIIPRLKIFWGSLYDADASGTITILFSSTLNEEKKAIGFFNPNDLYPFCDDISLPSYNPYSNEMDIIYAAIPEDESSLNYSENSISATLAHEMTHAINFSQRVIQTQDSVHPLSQMEVFLYEGLSQLSESLCGFGKSGGNSLFVENFLKNSRDYSFCKNNVYGFSDSVGQRGAVSLFLFWLFEKAGGRKWNTESHLWEDNGGISFLRKLVTSEKSEWDSIGEAFGGETDELFMEFCLELISCGITFDETDPITSEPVFETCSLVSYEDSQGYTVIPYSVFKISLTESFVNMTLSGKNLSHRVYAVLN